MGNSDNTFSILSRWDQFYFKTLMNMRQRNNCSAGHTETNFGFPDLSRDHKRKGRKRKAKGRKIPVHEQVALEVERKMIKNRVVKYADFAYGIPTPTAISTTVIMNWVTQIPQGVMQSDRVADTYYIHAVDVRMGLIFGDSTNFVRMVWFLWKFDNGTFAPISSLILENNAPIFAVWSPLDFEHRDNYSVLEDETFNLVSTASTGSQTIIRRFGLGGHRVACNMGAMTGVGHLYWCYASDSGVLPEPEVSIYYRVWFYDE